jgi:NAD+ kinase
MFFEVSPGSPKAEHDIPLLDGKLDVPVNTVVTLGGDGTLLTAIHKYGIDHCFVPMNYGTKGYLTNRSMSPEVFVARAKEEGIRWHAFDLLRLRQSEGQDALAFNDIAVQTVSGQSAKIRLWVDGTAVSDEPVICSGVIVSTAQGSTGYAFSAGGSCISPRLSAIGITWICPYNPRLPPMVVEPTSTIEIEVVDTKYRPCRVFKDGTAADMRGDRLSITTSTQKVRVGYIGSHDFNHRMISKVVR